MNKILLSLFFLSVFAASSQPTEIVLDRIIAVVGKNMILESEVKAGVEDARSKGYSLGENGDCEALDQILLMKLLLAQADKDSITVTDAEVENELNRRIAYMLQQYGTEENMINVLGKEIFLIKEELRKDVEELLIAQRMHQQITGDVKVSPSEVRAFLKSIPDDSLPLINTEVEIGQIIKKPEVSENAKKAAKEKIQGYRKRIVETGESFDLMATLYSEDPGSAAKNGVYQNIQRGQFVPEFEAAAFRLKPGEVSEVVETVYGYHIIKLLARRGDFIDVQHILVAPKMSMDDLARCKAELDSIYKLIKEGKITFCDAAAKYSDEKETKMNCGLMINMAAGNTRFEIEELGQMDDKLVFMLDKMNVGDISEPMQYLSRDQKPAYRIFYLKTRIPPHKPNLKDDYQRLQNYAASEKQERILNEWVNKKIRSTYIKIDPYYNRCKFKNNWLQTDVK